MPAKSRSGLLVECRLAQGVSRLEAARRIGGPALLAEWRLRLGLTRLEAAAKLEVAASTYSAWERGEWRPRPHHHPALERRTGVPTVAWLEPRNEDRAAR